MANGTTNFHSIYHYHSQKEMRTKKTHVKEIYLTSERALQIKGLPKVPQIFKFFVVILNGH